MAYRELVISFDLYDRDVRVELKKNPFKRGIRAIGYGKTTDSAIDDLRDKLRCFYTCRRDWSTES